MKSCPTCQRVYPNDAGFCPADGTALVFREHGAVRRRPTIARIGKRLCDRYEIRRVVADGGMGRVYEGIDKQNDTRIAVKVLHDDVAKDEVSLERFKREYEISAQAPARPHRQRDRLPARRASEGVAARHGVPRRRGAPRRLEAREDHPAGAPHPHALADGARPRRGARAQLRPPRSQAGQPVLVRHARGRRRQDPRLRIGQGQEQGREEAHRARHDDRLAVSTWRPSKRRGSTRSTRAPTSSRSPRSPTSASPASCRSRATTARRSSSRSSRRIPMPPSRARAERRSIPSRRRSTR